MKKLYILSTQKYNKLVIDRRILNQCDVFKQEGWNVFLCVLAEVNDIEVYQGINIIKICANQLSLQDIEFVYKILDIDHNLSKEDIPFTIEMTEKLYQDSFSDEILKQYKKKLGVPTLGYQYFYTLLLMNELKKGHPDAVYCADGQGILAAYLYWLENKTPYAIDFHEFFLADHNYEQDRQKIVRLVEKTAIKHSCSLVSVSSIFSDLFKIEYDLDYFPLSYYNVPKPILNYQNPKLDIRKIFNIPNQHKILLFQGGLSAIIRNLETLLDIAVDLKQNNIVLLFVGYGPLEERIKSLYRKNIVYFLDTLQQNDLGVLLQQVDAVIIPYVATDINQKYCAPNRLFDAISARKMVIANHSLEFVKVLVNTFHLGHIGPMDSAQNMLHTIVNAFAREEKIYTNLELIDEIFSFDSQARTIKTVSLTMLSEISKNRIKYKTEELLAEQLINLIDQKNLERAKKVYDRLKSFDPKNEILNVFKEIFEI